MCTCCWLPCTTARHDVGKLQSYCATTQDAVFKQCLTLHHANEVCRTTSPARISTAAGPRRLQGDTRIVAGSAGRSKLLERSGAVYITTCGVPAVTRDVPETRRDGPERLLQFG